MQLAKKSAVGLGLVVAMLASTVPTSEARAAVTPKQVALLSFALATTPYLINYFTRKPQEEARFVTSKLLYGSLKEKIKQLHYLISDTVFGWPYKDKKVVVKENDFGKNALVIQGEQIPGGILGNIHAWVLLGGGKALMFPATVMLYLSMWAAGIEWWMNPRLKAPDTKNAFDSLSKIALVRAATE